MREIDRNKKSAALRKYAKLCIKEGIVSDRVNLDSGNREHESKSDREFKKKDNKRKSGPAPFDAALKVAAERKAEKERLIKEKLDKEMEIKRAAKIRKSKQNDHLKRTKSGQPILNNQIKNILGKLQASK